MGMIIRVGFNNQNWAGRCRDAAPNRDLRLHKCQGRYIDTGYELDENGDCVGNHCWESKLCTKYYWGNSRGNFDIMRAYGNVFFVFPDIDNSLVLWGKSKVDRVEGNKVYFKPFSPMPPQKWVRNLSPKDDILGENWGQGTYRYLDDAQEARLHKLTLHLGRDGMNNAEKHLKEAGRLYKIEELKS
jgi:hypothetical protein